MKTSNEDTQRFAEIGRAVVEYLMPDDETALRQANAHDVVAYLRCQREETQMKINALTLDMQRMTPAATRYDALVTTIATIRDAWAGLR